MLIPKIVAGFLALTLFAGMIGMILKNLGYHVAADIFLNIGTLALIPVLLVVCLLMLVAIKESFTVLLTKINKKK